MNKCTRKHANPQCRKPLWKIIAKDLSSTQICLEGLAFYQCSFMRCVCVPRRPAYKKMSKRHLLIIHIVLYAVCSVLAACARVKQTHTVRAKGFLIFFFRTTTVARSVWQERQVPSAKSQEPVWRISK